jgi:hypothetical protein
MKNPTPEKGIRNKDKEEEGSVRRIYITKCLDWRSSYFSAVN